MSRVPAGLLRVRRFDSSALRIAACGLLAGNCAVAFAAKSRPAPLNKRGVDLIRLRDGSVLLGSLVQQNRRLPAVIAVRRGWLETAQPELWKREADRLQQRERTRLTLLGNRVRLWRDERADDASLLVFLDRELERVEAAAARAEAGAVELTSEFLLITIPREKVRRIYAQPHRRKQIALLAWREHLPAVEVTSIRDLSRQLELREIAAPDHLTDPSDRLPPESDTEREWAARVAICEFVYRRPVELQGTGNTLFRSDGSETVNAAELLKGLLTTQLDSALAKLAGMNGGRERRQQPDDRVAIAAASREGARGVRVTRVDYDLTDYRVSVHTNFLARMPDNRWQSVWHTKESLSTAKVPNTSLDRLRRDSRIATVITSAKEIGADETAVRTALRFEATTMNAQHAVDLRFIAFRDRFLDRLDMPRMTVGSQ